MSNEARREQLLDLCADIVDREGFGAVSIDDVARSAGVTRTVLYQQFGGLDGMLEALVTRSTERVAETLEQVTSSDAPTLSDAMSTVLEAVDADPKTWRMFLIAAHVGPPSLTENLETGRSLIRGRNESAIAHRRTGGAASGQTDHGLTARMLQAMADEMVRLHLADPDTYTSRRLIDQVAWLEHQLFAEPAPLTASDDAQTAAANPADARANPADAWKAFVAGLTDAGDQLSHIVTGADANEQADAFRALIRGLSNQLGRFEGDRDRPELTAFNGWRHKMFMDNPDFRYWVADIDGRRRYRVTGSLGDAVYQSITAYSSAGSGGLDANAQARIDSDSMTLGTDGGFVVTLSAEPPDDGTDWLVLPEGANTLWVRQFHAASETTVPEPPDPQATDPETFGKPGSSGSSGAPAGQGWCRIEPIDETPVPPAIDVARFNRRLRRLGSGMSMLPAVWRASTKADRAEPNTVRHWTAMTGGAAFTEPGIRYLRGSWLLSDDEALVIDGILPPCRYWNAVLYSRWLNSLDYRHRPVSMSGVGTRDRSSTARQRPVAAPDVSPQTGPGDRYRIVLAAQDPRIDTAHWLDTEGRPCGLFVFRFLQPETEPLLPTVEVHKIDRLRDRHVHFGVSGHVEPEGPSTQRGRI